MQVTISVNEINGMTVYNGHEVLMQRDDVEYLLNLAESLVKAAALRVRNETIKRESETICQTR